MGRKRTWCRPSQPTRCRWWATAKSAHNPVLTRCTYGLMLPEMASSERLIHPNTPMPRRTALRWLAAGAGLTLLAACGQAAPAAPTAPPPASTTPTQAAAPTAQAQPKSGGTLRMGMVGDLTQLEGQLIMPSTLDTLWQIYDR